MIAGRQENQHLFTKKFYKEMAGFKGDVQTKLSYLTERTNFDSVSKEYGESYSTPLMATCLSDFKYLNEFNYEFPQVVAAEVEKEFQPKSVCMLFLDDLEAKVGIEKQFLTCSGLIAKVDKVAKVSQELRNILRRDYPKLSDLLKDTNTQLCITELHHVCSDLQQGTSRVTIPE